jgi:TetR/AcrR family transcriptional regulator, transcriptional repressor of bet genes
MPRVVDAEHRRSELTDAAARLIARSGIESATLRDVAAEAGMTTGALTHYFTDKRELLLRTFEASLNHRRSLRPGQVDKPESRLRASLEGALILDEGRRRHWMVSIALCAQAAGDAELAAVQADAYREFRSHVSTLVRLLNLASGKAAIGLAERLIAAADGIAMQALFDPQSWSPTRQLKVLDQLIALHLADATQRQLR